MEEGLGGIAARTPSESRIGWHFLDNHRTQRGNRRLSFGHSSIVVQCRHTVLRLEAASTSLIEKIESE